MKTLIVYMVKDKVNEVARYTGKTKKACMIQFDEDCDNKFQSAEYAKYADHSIKLKWI